MRILRSWLGAVLWATLLVAPASAQGTTSSVVSGAGGPDPAVLRSIEKQVANLRGLQPLSQPDVHLLDHVALHDYLVAELERDYLPSERESDQKEFVALGLIMPTDDLFQIELDLLSDQVIGVYDSDARSLFVVADQAGQAFGPAEQMTYAHEFNHALQDQHFDLDRIAPKHPENSDHSMAAHAVVEGDAVMLETLWAQANLSPTQLIELARRTVDAGDGLARIPLIVRTQLLFPYVDGYSFVRQTYRKAGSSYAAVDDLLRNPPESTAQILHSEKYVNHVHPLRVPLPDLATELGSDWRQVGSGVLGELDTRILLEQWGTTQGEASRVASGWTGDQWQLIEKDGRSAIVFKSSWESSAAANDFFGAYSRGLRVRFDSATIEQASAARQALTTSDTATDLRIEGNEVLAVIAADRETADALVDAVSASAL